MLNAWNRAAHYRDLAEECRRLAETSFSTQMRNRFWRMAENYRMLAEAEELGAPAHGGLSALRELRPNGWRSRAPRTVRPRTPEPSPLPPPAHGSGVRPPSREQPATARSAKPARLLLLVNSDP
jgi:hypothetical protein